MGQALIDPDPARSLSRVFESGRRDQLFAPLPINEEPHIETKEVFEMVIDKRRKVLRINDAIQMNGSGFNLLSVLAAEFLKGAGQGLELLEYPTLDASKLATRTGLHDEAAVRQSVSRTRTLLGRKFASAGFDPDDGRDLLENLPWNGYRLRPDRVQVRILADN